MNRLDGIFRFSYLKNPENSESLMGQVKRKFIAITLDKMNRYEETVQNNDPAVKKKRIYI